MKRVLCILFIALLVFTTTVAEDYSSLTKEELLAKKAELLENLVKVNAALGALASEEAFSQSKGDLGTIESLFPDEQLAMFVRDQCAKFSISQPVTQEELDKVIYLNLFDSGYKVTDLTGIHYLRNLEYICIRDCNIKEIPDEIGTLKYVTQINAMFAPISSLPDSIGDMTCLEELLLDDTNISSLPDSICNLSNLEWLRICDTSVSSLPENIGNLLNLKKLDISHTKITSLPDSIWNLQLTELNMAGLPIIMCSPCQGQSNLTGWKAEPEDGKL